MRRLLALIPLAFLPLAACAPAPPNLAEQAIEVHFSHYGPEVVEEAKAVARCESGLDPTATNGQYLGLFQMGGYHYWRFEGNAWDDPFVNARAAGGLYAERGWQPWSCKP